MKVLASISTPVWIFSLTLLSIIVAGQITGSNSCESLESLCQADARKAHPDNAALQHAYVIRCSEETCTTGKSAAFVPLAIILAGGMLFAVWNRQSAGGRRRRLLAAAAPAAAPAAATKKASRATTKAAPGAGSKAATNAAAEKKPAAKKSGSTAATPTTTQKKSFTAVLELGDEPSKNELVNGLAAFTGSAEPEHWKGAPVVDLELLARGIAVAALMGKSKYLKPVAFMVFKLLLRIFMRRPIAS